MFKKAFFHGISAGLLSSLICYFFTSILRDEFYYEFSSIISNQNIIGATMFTSILASVLNTLAIRVSPKYGETIFNILFSIAVFASLLMPMLHKLPLDFDEYLTVIFPTYAMVLHFIPPFVWFALNPIFKNN